VFSYPGLLNEVDDKLIKIRQPDLAEGEVTASIIMPYGFDSYEEYYSSSEGSRRSTKTSGSQPADDAGHERQGGLVGRQVHR
jgi:hypothetical protein